MLDSIHAWFLWSIPVFFLDCITAFVAMLYLNTSKRRRKMTVNDQFIFLLFCLSTVWQQWGGFEIFSSFHPSFFFLLCFSSEIYRRLIKSWTTTYAFIIAVSLAAWLFLNVNPNTSLLPNLGVISNFDNDSYVYENYVICLYRPLSLRFNSIFLEPGHVAMYAVFTIAVNKFDLRKWQTIILIIGIIFTFSLAGYILIIVGTFLYNLLSRNSFKRSFAGLALLGAIVVPGYFYAKDYNHGNNLVNLLIIDRLEYNEETGIEGNNRTTQSTNIIFNRLLSSIDLLMGLPESEFKSYMTSNRIHGAGYKIFLLHKGIVGVALFLLIYYLLYRRYRDKRLGMTLFLLYIISFIQRATPFIETWIFLFLFASALNCDSKESVVSTIDNSVV